MLDASLLNDNYYFITEVWLSYIDYGTGDVLKVDSYSPEVFSFPHFFLHNV